MPGQKSQCDYCAFKTTEDQSSLMVAVNVEDKYKTLRGAKGAPKKPRIAHASNTGEGDKTETCAANSSNWPQQPKKDTYCTDFIENNISLEAALSLREARMAHGTSKKNNIIALSALLVSVFVGLFAYLNWEAIAALIFRAFGK